MVIGRIQTHTAKVGITKYGYGALPLTEEQATAGFRVVGLDPDAPKLEQAEADDNRNSVPRPSGRTPDTQNSLVLVGTHKNVVLL